MLENWKPSATERKLERQRDRRDTKSLEAANKREAKRRDGHRCRFPLCGCRRMTPPLRLEVSHQGRTGAGHKGAGGDPMGLRSEVDNLLTLCVHRHQDGAISIHKGTLRAVPLQPSQGTNGPVKWEAWLRIPVPGPQGVFGEFEGWYELAHETAVQQLAELNSRQRGVLEMLAGMKR